PAVVDVLVLSVRAASVLLGLRNNISKNQTACNILNTIFCISCSHTLSHENFVLEDKLYKTCSECLITKRTIKSDSINIENTSIEKISFKEISDYITDSLEYNNKLHINFHVIHKEKILNIADMNVKLMAKLIVNEIEEAGGYN
ncbi:14770_t:CDS:2, partial [Dentiscutata erythropus]